MNTWRLLLHPGLSGPRQMALDEALFLSTSAGGPPVLRLYTWQTPTLSLGFFQQYKEVVDEAFCVHNNIDVVRRLTGGRAVLHDREVTYAVVASLESGIFEGCSLQETYRMIAGALQAGLQTLGVDRSSILLDDPAPARSGPGGARRPQCFVSVSRYEISRRMLKIVGSAQKRSRDRFLQHGSILLDFDARLQQGCVRNPAPDIEARVAPLCRLLGRQPTFDEVAHSLSSAFGSQFGARLVPSGLTMEESGSTEMLENKYKSREWTEQACR